MVKEKRGANESIKPKRWSYLENGKIKEIPWGPHKLPAALELADVSIVVEKKGQGLHYRRSGAGENVEKTILTDQGSLLINPVEPVHRPLETSHHLLVEFEQAVVIEPRSSKEIMVTFPIELACVIEERGYGKHVIDMISITNPKFTLYGKIKDGLVCRYWKSAVYHDLPKVNPLEEGIMKIEIQNLPGQWSEVHRAVFSAHGMKIYYGPEMVSLNAVMKITGELTAETSFDDHPLKPGMRKSVERFSTRLLSQLGRAVMEEGY